MVKRILCAALALMLLPALATAELKWREDTPAMTLLKEYIETVNKLLAEHGEELFAAAEKYMG